MKISYDEMIEIIGATENVGLADAWLNGFLDLFFEMTNYFRSFNRSNDKKGLKIQNNLKIDIECGNIDGLTAIYLNDKLCRLVFSNAKHDRFSLEWNNYSAYNASNFTLYGKLNERDFANVPYIFCKTNIFKIPSKTIFDNHNFNCDVYHKSTSKNIEDVVDFNLFLIEKFKKIKNISRYDCILPWYTNKLDRMFIIDSLDETVFIDHLRNKIHIKNSELKEFVDYQKYLELKAFQ